MEKITLVAGTLNDIHFIGLKVLEYALEEEGFNIVHVGQMVTQEELIGAAQETEAKAILVSSSNGLAELDTDGFREKCREKGLGNILLYIGGNLVMNYQSRAWAEIESIFKKKEFNRVYPPNVPLEQVIKDLRQDLGQRVLK